MEPLKHVLLDEAPSQQLTEDRLAFEWSRIRGRLPPPRRMGTRLTRPRAVLLGLSVSAVAMAVCAVLFRPTERAVSVAPPLAPGHPSEIDGPAVVTLVDGSIVNVAPRSHIRILEERVESTHIRLDAGAADLEVTHRPGRSFVVVAMDVGVSVVGTRFRVAIEDAGDGLGVGVRVAVSRGVVEVTQAETSPAARIAAGDERWFGPAAAAIGGAKPSKPVDDPTSTGLGAPALFEQANVTRRAGRTEEAARLYQSLLDGFPHDRRAGLAALELGRLRMDTLGDLPGAAQAFRRATQLLRAGSLHEDAQARLVDALDGLHDRPSCRRARRDYLSRYGHGVHAIAVSARCAGR